MQGNNQFFAVFGSGGSSSGGGGVSGSGTLNYVAKWTPDGSTIGDSLIQDNGSEIGLNCTPDAGNGVRIEIPTTAIWSNALFTYHPDGRSGSNYNTIHSLSRNSNSGNTQEVAILGQVIPTTFQNSVQYVGLKGLLGNNNTNDHLGEHCGILGSSDQSGKDVKGVVGTIANGKSAIGVYGYLIDDATHSVDNFTGVRGYANIENTSVSGSAYGVSGSVDIADVTNLPTNNAGGSFGATMSANADAGTYTITALQSTGVNTTAFAGVLETAYSLKVGANTETFGTITNKYGIYQEGSDDLNLFNGNTGIGVAPNDDVRLGVAKTTVGSVATYGLNVENNSANNNSGANGINYGMYVNSENSGTGSAYGIYTRINNGDADGTNISVVNNATNINTNLLGVSCLTVVSGTITNLSDIYISSPSGAGTVTNYHGLRSLGMTITNCTDAYHIYLDGHTTGTNKYGIYQAGANDLNYFGANMGIGVTPVSSSRIKIAGADASTSAIQIVSSSATDVSSPNNGDLWYNGTNLYFYNGTSNTDLLAGGGGGGNTGTTTVKEYDSSLGDVDLYNDGNIRIGWDISGSDIEAEVLTNPATGRVNFVATVGGVITSVDGLTTTTPADLDSGFGNDESMYILINAPDDLTYPIYKIELKKSNNTFYTNTPFLVIATKYTSYD